MKTIVTIVSAAFLVSAFGFSTGAATKTIDEMGRHERACKLQAAKNYPAVHFLKRRAYVRHCMEKT